MDTKLTNTANLKKTVMTTVGVAIVVCLLNSQNLIISAKDMGIGNYTGISPTLNCLIEKQEKAEKSFHKKLNNKYSGSKIVEVEKGVKHIKMIRFYNNKPVRINIVELSTDINSRLNVFPATASQTLNTKSKISNIAERENAIVAINGGYFKPQNGIPLGALMINKKIYTGPIYDRVAIGIFEDGYDMARVKLKANIETNIGGLKIDNVNQPRMLSTHTIVYTRDWGKTTPLSPKYGSQLVIDKGKLIKFTQSNTEIPETGFVVVGPTKKLNTIVNAKKFKLNIKISPEWNEVEHVISGGPYLVKNGEIFVDMTAQKLSAIGGRNPRTAIGYTKDNHLIMLTADGREGSSIGLTLMELAQLMKEFGCINAMNLDGGGSTVMYVNGQVVNKPVVQGGIPLSHIVTVSLKKS